MTSLREAAQQALEAMDSILLTCSLGLGNDGIQIKQYMEAVTASRALRAALAQQAEPVAVTDRLARHGIPMPGDPK